ncbi:MAG: Lrp/AsnC family transcriptional regulator [Bacillus sp. (in: firmicutes)]
MHLNTIELEILKLIENNGRVDKNDLAKMVDVSLEDLEITLKKLEDMKVIVRYMTMIDWAKIDEYQGVTAMIDVKVAPKRGVGFDEVAKRIYGFKEVQSVYLMSGVYDISVTIHGKSMNEIASFVSQKLSTLDSVLSTTTHFILKKYKHDGIVFDQGEEDKRIVVSP